MKRGVALSVFASTLFAVISWWVTRMQGLSATEIFAWRMSLTGPLVTLLMAVSGQTGAIRQALRDIGRRPGVLLIHLLNAANVAGQMWVFMWAPLHGKALEASLGYFLMPLVMVLIGMARYREPLTRWQAAAAVFAAAGVAHEVWRVGSFGWIVPYIAIGFPLLFVIRRSFGTAGEGGTWVEFNLIFIVAAALLVRFGFTSDRLDASLGGLIVGLGAISAISMTAYYAASRALPFSLFGLLGYLEPVLLVAVAFVIGESLSRGELLTYVPIWIAVSLLAAEGVTRFGGTVRGRQRVQAIAGS